MSKTTPHSLDPLVRRVDCDKQVPSRNRASARSPRKAALAEFRLTLCRRWNEARWEGNRLENLGFESEAKVQRASETVLGELLTTLDRALTEETRAANDELCGGGPEGGSDAR